MRVTLNKNEEGNSNGIEVGTMYDSKSSQEQGYFVGYT